MLLISKNIRVFASFILSLLILLSYYSLEAYGASLELYRNVFIFYFTVVMLYIIIIAKHNNKYLIIALFFIANSTFMYARIIVNPPGNIYSLFFDYYNFSAETYLFMIKNLFYNLAGFLFGLMLIEFFVKYNTGEVNSIETKLGYRYKKIDYQIGQFIFILLLLLTIVNIYFVIQKISILYSSGYLAARAHKSLFLTAYSIMFLPFVMVGLSLKIPPKIKYRYLFLILAYGIIYGLQGGRGVFILSVFFYIWYSTVVFEKKINFIKISIVGFTLIAIVLLLSFLRSGSSAYTSGTILELVRLIFNEQGQSVGMLGYYYDYDSIRNIPHSVPYIFGIFHNFFLLVYDHSLHNLYATSAEFAQHSSVVGQRFSAILNPSLFDEGAGLGGCYIVEEYDLFGFFGVFFLTSIYILTLFKFQIYIIRRNTGILYILALLFVYEASFMPRSHYLTIGASDLIATLIVYGLYLLIRSLSPKRNFSHKI